MNLNISKTIYKRFFYIICIILICVLTVVFLKKHQKKKNSENTNNTKNNSPNTNQKILYSPEESLFGRWKVPYEKENILSDYDDLKDITFKSLLNEEQLLTLFKCYKLISSIKIDEITDFYKKLNNNVLLDKKKFKLIFNLFTKNLQNALGGKKFEQKSDFYKILFSIEIDSNNNVNCNYTDLNIRSCVFDKVIDFFHSEKFPFLLDEEKKLLFNKTLRSGAVPFSYMEIAIIIWSFESNKLYIANLKI